MTSPTMIDSGPWAGWKTWTQDVFETGTGPFHSRTEPGRGVVSAFIAEPRHMNGGGFMHGGCLLTFADYSCFAIADGITAGGAVTVNLSGDFLSAVSVGARLESTGEVTRAGGRLIYIRGMVTADGKPCLSFTSVITKLSGSKSG
ncbi:MAG: PaaI family thioesterase [Alphaproteobacteria bacterium]